MAAQRNDAEGKWQYTLKTEQSRALIAVSPAPRVRRIAPDPQVVIAPPQVKPEPAVQV